MKYLGRILVAFVVVGVIAFTGVFLLNQYNTGKIGNKAGNMAEKFQDELEGSWKGSYSISKLTFDDTNTVTLTVLGVNVDGTYKTSYDLKTEVYTVSVTYKTVLNVSVDLNFTAKIEENTLTLNEKNISSIEMKYTRFDGSEDNTQTVPTSENKSEKLDNKSENLRMALLGKWVSQKNSASGYDFAEDGTVNVSLLGISYNGNYSLEAVDGKLQITIVYASVAGLEAKNVFFVDIDNNILTFTEASNSTVKLYYTRSN